MRLRLIFLLLTFVFLLGIGLLTNWLTVRQYTVQSLAEVIAKNLEGEVAKSRQDLDVLQQTTDFFQSETQINYPVYVYQDSRIIYWSDNKFVPSFQQISDTSAVSLYNTGNEAWILCKSKAGQRRLISAIPLMKRYPISNDYLAPEINEKIFPADDVNISDAQAPTGVPVILNGQIVFKINLLQQERLHPEWRKVTVIVFVLALVVFTLAIYAFLPFIRKKSRELGFLYLLLALWTIRMVMTQFHFPGSFIHSPLFDAQQFASSSLNSSLADLFVNLLAVLALCVYVFRNYYRFAFVSFLRHSIWRWIISVVSGLCILFSTLFPVVVIQTLYNNSAIAIDISQSLQFDELRVFSILSVLVSGICAFLFSHAFMRILVMNRSKIRMVIAFVISISIFIVINELTEQQYISSLLIAVIYFFFIYIFDLYRTLKRLTFETFAYLLVAILFLSINGAYAIQNFTSKEKIENQYKFANNFLIDRDIFGEYLLHETSQKIARDVFTQTRIANPFLGKEAIRQKIRQVFLPSYFNKYDVEIFIFNSTGEPLDDREISLSAYITQYDKDAYKTGYDGIYFVNNEELDITQKYLIIIPVVRLSATAGYVIIQLSLKKIIPESVYPELLVDHRIQQSYHTQDLSYAVFANKSMVFSSGDFNYERFFTTSFLGFTALYTKSLSVADYDHIAVEDQSGRVAVVSAPKVSFSYKLANFSFLFVLGLLIVLLMIFIQGIYQYFRGSRLFFSARIQLYLNLAFFIPLIIVSVTTLSLTSKSSQQQLNNEYLNKSRMFTQQLVTVFDEENNSEGNGESVSGRLTDLAKLADLDASIFHADGTLMVTTQPLIFENRLISEYMNSHAYQRVLNGENLFIESERVGALDYFVSYSLLKSQQTGELIGILGIPFFQSAYLLERVQSVILINILNVFAFIFIILLLLSYIVADRLTFPLRFITQSLKRTSLNNSNTPLTWPASDEIGLMVKEYNTMLFKLSESKQELEQTQREKAWREIAQQVAHEIKNPLTPMKLTLQQLERALAAGNNSAERTSRAISTLLEQVDTLNEIASSFSGFVKMPEPVMQPVDLVSEVKRVVDLHSPAGEIVFRASDKEALVLGDKQLLSRTFSNLILNALQSGKPGQHVQVNITIDTRADKCTIAFRDNGQGISPQVAERLFVPHFTTKKSGSGLGLAIAKQAIEQMKGRIWFETQPEVGTSFFIELPILK